MQEQNYLSIAEFSEYLKTSLENNNLFKNVSVKGEIANLTHNKSGHIYFSLKDNFAKIDCAIWKSNAHKFLGLNISEGMEVVAQGSISYYRPSGKITFVVHTIRVDGVGALAIEYEKRLKELKNRGWCDEINKQPIPKIPTNIGIITAGTGDAIRDLISNIKRRFKLVNIYLFPTLVQGDGAAVDIASKIVLANNFSKPLDVLIVGRGGGSYEDLWAFNEWEVLTAIFNSTIPIITGIGHEPDITLADYVADKRASTPTAAGEYATPDINAIYKSLDNKQIQFANILKTKMQELKSQLSKQITELKNNLISKVNNIKNDLKTEVMSFDFNIQNKILNIKNVISQYESNLKNVLSKKMLNAVSEYKFLSEKLEMLNPIRPLEKGFVILKLNNKIVRSISNVKPKENLEAYLNDGIIDVKVLQSRKDG